MNAECYGAGSEVVQLRVELQRRNQRFQEAVQMLEAANKRIAFLSYEFDELRIERVDLQAELVRLRALLNTVANVAAGAADEAGCDGGDK